MTRHAVRSDSLLDRVSIGTCMAGGRGSAWRPDSLSQVDGGRPVAQHRVPGLGLSQLLLSLLHALGRLVRLMLLLLLPGSVRALLSLGGLLVRLGLLGWCCMLHMLALLRLLSLLGLLVAQPAGPQPARELLHAGVQSCRGNLRPPGVVPWVVRGVGQPVPLAAGRVCGAQSRQAS